MTWDIRTLAALPAVAPAIAALHAADLASCSSSSYSCAPVAALLTPNRSCMQLAACPSRSVATTSAAAAAALTHAPPGRLRLLR
jgi:hypothetical protein